MSSPRQSNSAPDPGAATVLPGRVVATYGRRLLVEDEHRKSYPGILRGRRLRVVTGDRVHWVPATDDGDSLVTGTLPRDNELRRPDSRGKVEVIAANISQLLVVVAPQPTPDPFMVDRYLVAAELMGAATAVVYNKTDLAAAAPPLEAAEYAAIGYEFVYTSATTGSGLDALRAVLGNHTSILVGQSGVGKSSLLNALLPGLDTATAELTAATGMGRHTTSASVLHHLPSGGDIIDSPGVRDYAPAPVPEAEIADGFPEFRAPARECRFTNCRHLREPDCGVKSAAAAGRVSERRYASYRRVVNLMREVRDRSSP